MPPATTKVCLASMAPLAVFDDVAPQPSRPAARAEARSWQLAALDHAANRTFVDIEAPGQLESIDELVRE